MSIDEESVNANTNPSTPAPTNAYTYTNNGNVTVPSLWTALDNVQLCYTVIPQMKHYYRYGTFRNCADARRELSFAFSLKGKSEEEQIEITRQREDAKFEKKITERSSSAVWTLRTEPPPNFPPKV
ncbi:hypothetical protein HK100_007209 [Physocladia obscura]|uniref:Uncharacterized protein n=1 Tax=Physocladia obscura TaxID=109957 RepID=A0AAD5T6K6_9FUNG|nr:hypothetical protein HK100_007209 [Physocladia obscura]